MTPHYADEEISTVAELVRAVSNSRTGGYEVDFDILPNRAKAVASGTREGGDRTFFLLIDVRDSDPDSEINGEWWFWADDTVMQVL